MQRLPFCAGLLLLPALLPSLWPVVIERFDFENTESGTLPAGWLDINSDPAYGENWAVFDNMEAASGTKIFAKIALLPEKGGLPMTIWQSRSLRDGEVGVHIEPMGGIGLERAGLVFRYRDRENYSLVGTNLRTGEGYVKRIETGRTISVATTSVGAFQPKPDGWTLLRVRFVGPVILVYINGHKCIEAVDPSAERLGRVGLWAAPGTFANFDDFEVVAPD